MAHAEEAVTDLNAYHLVLLGIHEQETDIAFPFPMKPIEDPVCDDPLKLPPHLQVLFRQMWFAQENTNKLGGDKESVAYKVWFRRFTALKATTNSLVSEFALKHWGEKHAFGNFLLGPGWMLYYPPE